MTESIWEHSRLPPPVGKVLSSVREAVHGREDRRERKRGRGLGGLGCRGGALHGVAWEAPQGEVREAARQAGKNSLAEAL